MTVAASVPVLAAGGWMFPQCWKFFEIWSGKCFLDLYQKITWSPKRNAMRCFSLNFSPKSVIFLTNDVSAVQIWHSECFWALTLVRYTYKWKNIRAKGEIFAPIFSKNTKFPQNIEKYKFFATLGGLPQDISGGGTVPLYPSPPTSAPVTKDPGEYLSSIYTFKTLKIQK